ncbi:Uncharacterized protein TCM_021431 [Theobroma cacao]|uniref:Uncharacterized protein n=1 Tax=Theobroma cacao TaxID=3641 RepID=A0A061EX23_THECC|nr:Uncharacterized protein TCM_021431 [Theobroma cacao]
MSEQSQMQTLYIKTWKPSEPNLNFLSSSCYFLRIPCNLNPVSEGKRRMKADDACCSQSCTTGPCNKLKWRRLCEASAKLYKEFRHDFVIKWLEFWKEGNNLVTLCTILVELVQEMSKVPLQKRKSTLVRKNEG